VKKHSAFTLAELLVALALTSGLAVLLMTIVSGAMNVWQHGRNQIDTFSNARQTLNRMADELKGAIATAGQVEFSENLSALQGTTAPVPGSSENIFFVAPYPNSGAGDLCVIAYRLNADTHELQRAFLKSDDAWNVATNRYRSAGYSTNFSSASTWQTIARGVLQFEIKSYSQADLDANTTPVPTWNSEIAGTGMSGNVPRRVLLRLQTIDDKSLVRLNAVPATGAAHDRIVAQSMREFTADLSLLPPH
jgi:type II secretory pathway component PulJ